MPASQSGAAAKLQHVELGSRAQLYSERFCQVGRRLIGKPLDHDIVVGAGEASKELLNAAIGSPRRRRASRRRLRMCTTSAFSGCRCAYRSYA